MVQFWVAGLFKSYGVLYVEIMETFPDSSESVASWIPAALSTLCLALGEFGLTMHMTIRHQASICVSLCMFAYASTCVFVYKITNISTQVIIEIKDFLDSGTLSSCYFFFYFIIISATRV